MTKPLKHSQIVPDDGGIDRLIEKLKAAKKEFIEFAKTVEQKASKLSPANKQDQESLNKMAKEVEELRTKYAGTDEQLKKLIRTKEQYNTRQSAAKKETQRYQEELKKEERYTRTNIKADIARKGSIEALEAETNKLIAQRKRLQILNTKTGTIVAKNVKEYQRLTTQIKANTDQLKRFDVAIGRSQRFVGQYARAMTGLWNQVRLLAASYLGFYGAIRLGRNLVSTFSGFESKMAGVRAITEATDEEFKSLEQDARRLGGATIFTSQQVADLQTEFGKLGFSTQEIIDATEATLGLAAATDEGLAESAAVAGATLRAFNLQASETQRMVDVMAKSFTSSALNLEKFRESMKFVAPVAAKANFSIEGTTAILGKLADSGLYGSLAGTALRNVILRLADSSSKLSKRIGTTVKSFDDFIPAMKKLSEEGVSISEALELTDRRAVTAFTNLLGNIDGVEVLAEKLSDAAGAAEEMSNVRMDTLAGDARIAVSALQEFAIVIGDQVKGRMREFVQAFTELIIKLKENGEAIKNFIKFVLLVISSLISFRVATLAANVAGKAFGAMFLSNVNTMGLFTAATIRARQAIVALTTAMKANWFGLLATAAATLVTYLFLYEDRAKAATKATKSWSEQMAEAIAPASSLFETLKKVNPGTELHKELIKKINAEYGDYITNLLDEKSSLEDIEKAQKEVNMRLLENLAIKNQQEEIAKINKETIKRETEELEQLANTYGKNVRNVSAAYRQALKGDFSDIDALFGNLEDKIINVGDTQITVPGLSYIKDRIQDLADARKLDEQAIEQIINKYSAYIYTIEEEVIPEEEKLIWTLEKLREERKKLIEDAEKLPEDDVKAYRQAAAEIAEYTKRIEFLENILDPKKSKGAKKKLDYEKKLQELIIRNKYEGFEEEKRLEENSLKFAIKQAKLEIKNHEVRNKYIEQLQIEHEQKMQQIKIKYAEQDRDFRLEEINSEKKIADSRVEFFEESFKKRQEQERSEFLSKKRFSGDIQKFDKKQAEEREKYDLQFKIKALQNEADYLSAQMNARARYVAFVLRTDKTMTDSARERMEKELAYNVTITEQEIDNIIEVIETYENEIQNIGTDNEISDIWDLVGIKMEDGEKSQIKSSFDFAVDQINRIADAKVQAAQRAIDAADREVDAAENRYNRETELQVAGLANSAKTASRQLAIARENQKKALEQQRKAQEEQQKIQIALQATNLLTATSKILAEFGLPAALPFIALLWGLWAYSAVKVNELTNQQYGEGGYEELAGGSHASGKDVDLGRMPDGRKRRGEGGEGMAVFNRKSTRKYKDRLPKLVKAINHQKLDDFIMENTFQNNYIGKSVDQVYIQESKHVSAIRKTVEKISRRGDNVVYSGISRRTRK